LLLLLLLPPLAASTTYTSYPLHLIPYSDVDKHSIQFTSYVLVLLLLLLLLLPLLAASTTYTSYPLHLIPYSDVDKLLQEDFSHGDGSYTIYLLNPPAHAPYAYTYQQPGR
jgi:hypothetical protein